MVTMTLTERDLDALGSGLARTPDAIYRVLADLEAQEFGDRGA